MRWLKDLRDAFFEDLGFSIFAIIMLVILAMAFMKAPRAYGDGLPELIERKSAPGLEARELSLEMRRMQGVIRKPYYPGKDDWYSYVGLDWNVSLWRLVYWENNVFFYGDRSQVRNVGWHYDLGVHVTNQIDVYWHHESEHDADHDRADPQFPERGKFPLENSYGIKINFLKK